jgi:hypothetical protein
VASLRHLAKLDTSCVVEAGAQPRERCVPRISPSSKGRVFRNAFSANRIRAGNAHLGIPFPQHEVQLHRWAGHPVPSIAGELAAPLFYRCGRVVDRIVGASGSQAGQSRRSRKSGSSRDSCCNRPGSNVPGYGHQVE